MFLSLLFEAPISHSLLRSDGLGAFFVVACYFYRGMNSPSYSCKVYAFRHLAQENSVCILRINNNDHDLGGNIARHAFLG